MIQNLKNDPKFNATFEKFDENFRFQKQNGRTSRSFYSKSNNIDVLDYQNQVQRTDPDERYFDKMKIVVNPNGTLTEIDPRTNKMLPIKPQNIKIIKPDFS